VTVWCLRAALPSDPVLAYPLALVMGVLMWLGCAAVLIVAQEPCGKMRLRRIALMSLIAGVLIFALHSAKTTFLLLRGDLPYDPLVPYGVCLLPGLVLAALLIGKSLRWEEALVCYAVPGRGQTSAQEQSPHPSESSARRCARSSPADSL
jgi:hypothetical protein